MGAERYFVCHSGSNLSDDVIGMIGRVYAWRGEWIRSPKDVSTSERNAVMKLYALWHEQLEVAGDVGCFTEVLFEDSPRELYAAELSQSVEKYAAALVSANGR